ncbi:hypothetical protein LCGC14_2694470 [marine sediment metagenome]|uniref:Uncharacterized protein n=1 Tax=marine sediment metagenome TaxID=412755 RepID=A0A0F9A531_9ZZZZ
MGTTSVGLSPITVVTQYLKTLREALSDQPKVEGLPKSVYLPHFSSIIVDVVYCQEYQCGHSATCTLASVGLNYFFLEATIFLLGSTATLFFVLRVPSSALLVVPIGIFLSPFSYPFCWSALLRHNLKIIAYSILQSNNISFSLGN